MDGKDRLHKKYKVILDSVEMWIWRRVTKTIWGQCKAYLKFLDEVSKS